MCLPAKFFLFSPSLDVLMGWSQVRKLPQSGFRQTGRSPGLTLAWYHWYHLLYQPSTSSQKPDYSSHPVLIWFLADNGTNERPEVCSVRPRVAFWLFPSGLRMKGGTPKRPVAGSQKICQVELLPSPPTVARQVPVALPRYFSLRPSVIFQTKKFPSFTLLLRKFFGSS